jgi:uncharacterized protein DUF6602
VASVPANHVRYLVSMASELLSQATRVRDLIGGVHWLSDGHHKEFLLIELLRRHLPNGLLASRGFVIDPNDDSICSREQDILIVDTNVEGPVFHQAGVIIALPRSIRAAVSVKTTCERKTVIDSVQNLNSLRTVIARHVPAGKVWCGAYYFEPDKTVRNDPIKPLKYIIDGVRKYPVPTFSVIDNHLSPQGPDLQCTGQDLSYRMSHAYRDGGTRVVAPRIHGYRCNGLATALFLGSLLDHLARARGQSDCDFMSFTDGSEFDQIGERELPIPV